MVVLYEGRLSANSRFKFGMIEAFKEEALVVGEHFGFE